MTRSPSRARARRAATLVSYALVLALVALAAVASLDSIGAGTRDVFLAAGDGMATAQVQAPDEQDPEDPDDPTAGCALARGAGPSADPGVAGLLFLALLTGKVRRRRALAG